MIKTALIDPKSFNELLILRGFYSLREFAEKAHIGYHSVQQVTSGARNPSIKTALKIAAALDIPFDDLFKFIHWRVKYDGGETAGGETEA